MSVKTRIAPSPTGDLHVGHLRTLLYNVAFTKKNKGKFVVRIEDTDQERYVKGAVQRTLDTIKAYGISWDEGPDVGGPNKPYVQSERLDLYKKYAKELIDKDAAYYCFCTKEDLDELRKKQQKEGMPITKYDKRCLKLSKDKVQKLLDSGAEHVIRLNVPPKEQVVFNDEVYGKLSFDSSDIDDQILLKSDGFPTYHLAVVVDDHLMGITHVMRGNDWLPSTPKRILIYKALGWDLPTYIHLPNLKELGGDKKLSKRFGAVSAQEFLEKGYLPEAVLNFLMFLGWNPGTDEEVYSLDKFASEFNLKRVHKTDLVSFDREKLLWFNGVYIRNLDTNDLIDKINTWSNKYDVDLSKLAAHEDYKKIISLVQERLKTFDELVKLTNYFVDDPDVDYDLLIKYTKDKKRASEILTSFDKLFDDVGEKDWTESNLDKICHKLIEDEGYKPKEAFMTLRVAITGAKATPPIFDVMEVLGAKCVRNRITKALSMLD